MTREIMKEIRELIAKGYSGREIMAMGYAESTVRKVGDTMALRGELPGVREIISKNLLRAGSAEVLKQIRRELREKGFKQGSIDAVLSKLRRKGNLEFDSTQDLPLAGVKQKTLLLKAYHDKEAQIWKAYREKIAQLKKACQEELAQLWQAYREEKAPLRKTYREKKALEDKVEALQKEVEARDRLLKKLMNRLNQPIEAQVEKAAESGDKEAGGSDG